MENGQTNNDMDDRIRGLIAKYLTLFPADPVVPSTIAEIEGALGVVLPPDLKCISSVYGGGILGGIEHVAIGPGPGANMIDETLSFRAALRVPSQFVYLAYAGESFIMMETQDREDQNARVIWVDNAEADRLSDAEAYEFYAEFDSYSTFFEHLIGAERDIRS